MIPLVSSFTELALSLVSVFTQPGFQNFLTLLAGWVFCMGRHTITNLIVAAGAVETKHFSCFHRLFSRAVWNFDSLGFVLLKLALRFVPEVREATVVPQEEGGELRRRAGDAPASELGGGEFSRPRQQTGVGEDYRETHPAASDLAPRRRLNGETRG